MDVKPPATGGIGQAAGDTRNFLVDNWPLLAGVGLTLGGAGLWWKNKRDREQEEEEQALLSGMHHKAGMVKLAAEFPVQIGFLVRCNERRLTGTEVRVAIEKCAAISDAMAEDWIHFFGAAAGLEAEATSGMMKAADDPDAAIKKTPLNPLKSSAGDFNASATAADTAQPKQPAIQALQGITGGAAPAGAAAAPAAPAQPVAPGTVAAQPQPQQPVPPDAVPGAAAVAASKGLAQPSAANRLGIPTLSEAMKALPDAGPEPYRTNVEQRMMGSQSESTRAKLRVQRQYLDQLSRAAASPHKTEAERYAAQQEMNRLQADRPEYKPMGSAGLRQPMTSSGELMGRKKLETDAFQRAIDERADYANDLSSWRWMPSVGGVAKDMQETTGLMNRGVPYRKAMAQNWSAPAGDLTAGQFGNNAAFAVSHGPGAIFGVPAGATADFQNWMRGGEPSMEHTRSAARDFMSTYLSLVSPGGAAAKRSGGIFSPEHVPSGGKGPGSMFLDTAPALADKMQEYAKNTENGNPLLRTLADHGSGLVRMAGPIASSLALGGIPGGGGAATVEGAAAPAATGLAKMIPGAVRSGWGTFARNFGGILPRGGTGTTAGYASFLPNYVTKQFLSPRDSADDMIRAGLQNSVPIVDNLSMNQMTGVKERGMSIDPEPTPWNPATNPPPHDLRAWPEARKQLLVGRIADVNEMRAKTGKPALSPGEQEALEKVYLKSFDDLHDKQRQQAVVGAVESMRNPDGTYNPNGTFDIPVKDPKNLAMSPQVADAARFQAAMDNESLTKLNARIPPELAGKVERGMAITPQEQAILTAQNVDIPTIQRLGTRFANAKAVEIAHDQFRGDLVAARAAMGMPVAMEAAAKENPSLVKAGEKEVESGLAANVWEGIKNIWNTSDPMTRLLLFGGAAVGIVGLLNSVLGEGGLGSILMTLLGGGAAVLGANKLGLLPEGMSGPINSAADMFGLGDLVRNQAVQPMTEDQLNAAMAPTPTAPGNPPPEGAPAGLPAGPAAGAAADAGLPGASSPVAPGAPAAPAGAAQTAPPEPDFRDLNVRRDLVRMAPDARVPVLYRAMQANPEMGAQIAKVADNWGITARLTVLPKLQKVIPDIDMEQAQAGVDTFKRLPPRIQEEYRKMYKLKDVEEAAAAAGR